VKHIRLIVTGDLERKAMIPSLCRLFPDKTANGEAVEWLSPHKTMAGTTNRLRADSLDAGMKGLAKKMVAEAWEGEDDKPADLVIAIDDVELHNFDQQSLICEKFREAVEFEFARRAPSMKRELYTMDELRERVHERCSFHLLCPMIEAYLFADRDALTAAGCAANVTPRLASSHYEDFECCDPTWLPTCHEQNRVMVGLQPPATWWREQRHAKHYLEHLVEQNGEFYTETIRGTRAFSGLAWSHAESSGAALPLMRALLEDLADFFIVPNPLGDGASASPLTYPTKHVDRRKLLLRNM
jgi:hypothetical protein